MGGVTAMDREEHGAASNRQECAIIDSLFQLMAQRRVREIEVWMVQCIYTEHPRTPSREHAAFPTPWPSKKRKSAGAARVKHVAGSKHEGIPWEVT